MDKKEAFDKLHSLDRNKIPRIKFSMTPNSQVDCNWVHEGNIASTVEI